MKLRRFSTLGCLIPLVSACSEPANFESTAASNASIIEGLPSTAEENFVVHLLVPGVGNCTATLVAPNTVLTALHCVAAFDASRTYTCNTDGTVNAIQPGGGALGEVFAPERVEIRVGTQPFQDPPSAFGIAVFGSGSNAICHGDIALVVLDRNLELEPQHVRFQKPVLRTEYETIIGYGQTEAGSIGIRNRRTGRRVLAVGEYGPYRAQGIAVPDTFVLGQGSCHGDSGGPAFDEETNVITGVASLLETNDCVNSDQNVFTQVAPFEALVREALNYAGFEPLVEPGGDGAGGEGGTGSVEPGAGGEAAGGGSSQTGGTTSTGEGGMAGSDTGEGGEGAFAATGGSAATGATGGSNGHAGRNPGVAGTSDTPQEGSGSRSDASCACRLDGTRSSRGLGWAGFLSLLAVALLRRRAR